MDVRAICWDWNGTLLDDADICHEVMNRVLSAFGRPPLIDRAAYRALFRFPIRDFYADAGLGEDVFQEAASCYLDWLAERTGEARLHAGAGEVLSELSARGTRQVLASATLPGPLERQMRGHGLADRFEEVLTVTDAYRPSKQDVIGEWLHRSELASPSVLMIGDTNHDREIAEEFGMRFVHFDGGHQRRPSDVEAIADLRDLMRHL